jgi:citrate lyase subunit beta/citryl-CoA lyase
VAEGIVSGSHRLKRAEGIGFARLWLDAVMILRSLLFAPGDHPRRREKAFLVGADGVVLDLEDAVALSQKDSARQGVAVLLQAGKGPTYTVVRVNPVHSQHFLADIEAVVYEGLDAVMLPKVESETDVHIADWLISDYERRRHLVQGSVELHAVVETARGLMATETIARSTRRLRRIVFGVADFTLDTGMEWSSSSPFLTWVGAMVVTVSRAAGLDPPLDTVYKDLGDAEGFRNAAKAARALGFQGKTCLHPNQVAIANEVFTPGEAEVTDAWAVYSAFQRAERAGRASIQLDGRFIDYPIAEHARRVLEAAQNAGKLPEGYRLDT